MGPAAKAGKFQEMLVVADQDGTGFQGMGADPDVIDGNWRAGPLQPEFQFSKDLSRFLIDIEWAHRRFRQKGFKPRFVFQRF